MLKDDNLDIREKLFINAYLELKKQNNKKNLNQQTLYYLINILAYFLNIYLAFVLLFLYYFFLIIIFVTHIYFYLPVFSYVLLILLHAFFSIKVLSHKNKKINSENKRRKSNICIF